MVKKRGIVSRAVRAPADYPILLQSIKQRIHAAQIRAAASANAELLYLYWDIGRAIARRQGKAGWGAAVIPRLSRDLRIQLPKTQGFSERNIGRMIAFYRAYPDRAPILPPPVAKIEHLPNIVAPSPSSAILPPPVAKLDVPSLAQIPWAHHVLLLERVKDIPTRIWYMHQTVANGWSRSVLLNMISAEAHHRTGKAVTNFAQTLSPAQSELATQLLKDPYIFDFLTIEEPFHERELETDLLNHIQNFLLELGQGFAFVGRQHRLTVDGEEFSIDLLFYHLRLRCFVVIDLKTGAFMPEHAGKMNFYCNVVDKQLRHADDKPTIGLILCRRKKRLIAEYALKGLEKAVGVSQYQLTRALPARFQSSLPSIAEIEAELSRIVLPRLSAATPRKGTRKKPAPHPRRL